MEEKWAVVGGGMLGLTAALRLAGPGRKVTLIEAKPRLGGLTDSWRLDDVQWDRFYHVILLSDYYLRRLLGELDLEDQIRWVTTRTGCYARGRHYSVSNSFEFFLFPPLNLADKIRLAGTIFYASRIRNWRRLEKQTVSEWLVRWSGKRTFERFWLPLLKSKLGENYKQTSAAFIWATIQRLYSARRTGLKREMFGYLPGGYARIIDRFVRRLREKGVTLETGRPVLRIGRSGKRLEVEFQAGENETYDGIVVTSAAPIAARICADLSEDEKDRLESVRYQGIVCGAVLLRKPITPFYVTNILDDSVPFTGVIGMSTLLDPKELGGKFLVYLPKYVASDDPFLEVPDSEVEETFLAGLEKMYSNFDRRDVVCFKVARTPYVNALTTLGYSERVPPMKTSVPGLYLAGSAHILNGTLNVNETVRIADRVTTMILERHG